jgi:hypothetical protein
MTCLAKIGSRDQADGLIWPYCRRNPYSSAKPIDAPGPGTPAKNHPSIAANSRRAACVWIDIDGADANRADEATG